MPQDDPLAHNSSGHTAIATIQAARDVCLVTKVHIPRARSFYVERVLLTEQLQASSECDLTLLSAPAGCGKTVLLSHWLATSEVPVAWLSLEAEDNEPVRFFSYIVAALQTLYPLIGQAALSVLIQSPQPGSIVHAMALLSNEITSSPTGRFVFVCDDYHLIHSEAIHEGLLFLLEHLPPQMHLIIATRVDPPFPLTRLRVRGRLAELRTADLRLQSGEIQTLLENAVSRELNAEVLRVIEQRTEGWVAGVQLAGISLRSYHDVQAFLRAFNGNHRFVLDYLMEEVVLQQPAVVQSFLFSTCILERLSAPLCNALTEREDAQEHLAWLEKANLFVIALDDARQWYRYHHLFAEVLRARSVQWSADHLAALHLRASQWYELHGFVVEALHHAIGAHKLERVISLLEEHGMTYIFTYDLPGKVLIWLQGLSNALVQSRVPLCLLYALASLYAAHFDDVTDWLLRAEELLAEAEPFTQHDPLRGMAKACYALLAMARGDVAQSAAHAREALELLPADMVLLRSHVTQCAIRAFQSTGDVTQETERLAVAAVSASRASNNPAMLLMSMANLSWIQVLRGRLHQASATYRETMRLLVEQEPDPWGQAEYAIGIGHILREWNQFTKAEEMLVQGLERFQSAPIVNAELMTHGYLTLARIYQAQGAYEQACTTIERLNKVEQEQHFSPYLLVRSAARRAEIELSRGDIDIALRWVQGEEHTHTDLPEPPLFVHEREFLSSLRIYSAQARISGECAPLQELMPMLELVQKGAEEKARIASVLEAMILRILILDLLGEDHKALMLLEQALRIAEPEDYVRLFADEGEPMARLLTRLRVEHLRRREYVQKLIRSCRSTREVQQAELQPALLPRVAPTLQPLIEPLSDRELEVLQWLATGASNQDIAAELVIAVSTVKRHVTNIIAKLEVNNRTQAVVSARKYGLL